MLTKRFFIPLIIILCCSFTSILHRSESNAAMKNDANHYMWDQLHHGNYDSINEIIQKLKTEWYAHPDDPKLNTHLGFIYLWKFCERGRAEPDPIIFQNIFTSNFFFKKAIELNPGDTRLYSLQAATEMCEGAIREDLKQIANGYQKGLKAVQKWPQFNRFALAAMEGMMHKNSRMFRQGMRYQWITMDECSCKKLTKRDVLHRTEKTIGGLVDELLQSSDTKIKRACWNSWVAPHNFEGYLLNFGDMLVKQGKLKEAEKIYSAIKLAPTYQDWVYKDLVDERIRNEEVNEKLFNRKLELLFPKGETQLFINSQQSCVACHQMSDEEFQRSGYQEPGAEIYSTDRKSRQGKQNN